MFVEELVYVAIGAGRAGMGILYSHAVLHHPFVDCFRWVCHVDFSSEVCFAENVWKRRGVVHVETVPRDNVSASFLLLLLLRYKQTPWQAEGQKEKDVDAESSQVAYDGYVRCYASISSAVS